VFIQSILNEFTEEVVTTEKGRLFNKLGVTVKQNDCYFLGHF